MMTHTIETMATTVAMMPCVKSSCGFATYPKEKEKGKQ